MTGAFYLVTREWAISQRSVIVATKVGDGEKAAVNVEDEDCFLLELMPHPLT
jgi:hypothetical protein